MNVKKVAGLANLPITDTELTTYEGQLNSVLGYVDQLQKVDLSGVAETSQVTGLKNVGQADKQENFAPLMHGYVKVKAIFDQND